MDIRAIVAASCVVVCCARAGAQAWDNVADFSFADNPNGAWTFGKSPTRPTVGVTFSPFSWSYSQGDGGLWFWIPVHGFSPVVAQNVTDAAIALGDNTVCPARTQFCQPGSAGQNAVIRWTAPASATIDADVQFGGVVIDPDATSTDVAVLHNGVVLFSADLSGVGAGASAWRRIVVAAGDWVDFCVGSGSDGSASNDSTAVRITINVVCPADFDGSGFVDTDDFTAFTVAFEAGTDDADFDGSGFVDTDDFTAFVIAFEGGC